MKVTFPFSSLIVHGAPFSFARSRTHIHALFSLNLSQPLCAAVLALYWKRPRGKTSVEVPDNTIMNPTYQDPDAGGGRGGVGGYAQSDLNVDLGMFGYATPAFQGKLTDSSEYEEVMPGAPETAPDKNIQRTYMEPVSCDKSDGDDHVYSSPKFLSSAHSHGAASTRGPAALYDVASSGKETQRQRPQATSAHVYDNPKGDSGAATYDNVPAPQVATYDNVPAPQVATYDNVPAPQVAAYDNVQSSLALDVRQDDFGFDEA